MDWEAVLVVAIVAVGTIQYLKGVVGESKRWVWVALQPVLCIASAVVWHTLPKWVSIGLVGFSASQIGYESIIQIVKKKFDRG